MTQTRNDAISVLVDDHRAVDEVFQDLERGGQEPQQRRDLVDHVIAELVKHSVAEEHYLYPATRKSLSDGNEIADHELSEHNEAEQVMHDLIQRDPSDPQFEEKLGTLMSAIRHHVEGEEGDLFPQLREACNEQELVDLAQQIMNAKENAPTRPHPSSPNQPPANKLLDPGAGMIDRMRDAMQNRQT